MNYIEEPLKKHHEWKDKIKVITDIPVKASEDLSFAYTPGVAQPCLETQKDVNKFYELTRRWSLCAIVTDGTTVLSLGDIGLEAGMPIMEGKCVLFKTFGDVDAFPLYIRSGDVDEIASTVYLLSGSSGGVNLEDVAAPHHFEIKWKLEGRCDIPAFHDNQHDTTIVVLSGLINALKVVGKDKEKVRVVMNRPGSMGITVPKLLLSYGSKDPTLCNHKGVMIENSKDLNWTQKKMLEVMSLNHKTGTPKDALVGADIFLGFSGPNMVTETVMRSMNRDVVTLACANSTPGIFPDEAKRGDTKIVSTDRSDFPSQINNVFVFPGLFRGVFNVRVKDISEEMKMTTVIVITNLILDDEVNESNIIPKAFDSHVKEVVAKAVTEAVRRTGVAKI